MNNKGQILDTMTALTIGQRKMLKEQGVLKGVQLEIEKRMHAFEYKQAEIKSLQEELMYSSTTLRRRRQDGTFEVKKIGEKWFYLSSSLCDDTDQRRLKVFKFNHRCSLVRVLFLSWLSLCWSVGRQAKMFFDVLKKNCFGSGHSVV